MRTFTSTLAIACLLAAYPVAALAQSSDNAEETETEEGATQVETEDGTTATEETDATSEASETTSEGSASDSTDEQSGSDTDTEASEEAGASEGSTETDTSGDTEATGDAEATTEDGSAESDATDETSDMDATEESGTAEEAAEASDVPVEGQEVEGQIVMQGENSLLANDLIGATVYSNNDESIGEIDDMIINLDGTVEGVVIGVGGFLGLGEKDVAIEMSNLTVVMTDADTPQLRLASTREELEAAPEFVTARQQEVDAEMEQQQQEMQENLDDPVGEEAPAATDN